MRALVAVIGVRSVASVAEVVTGANPVRTVVTGPVLLTYAVSVSIMLSVLYTPRHHGIFALVGVRSVASVAFLEAVPGVGLAVIIAPAIVAFAVSVVFVEARVFDAHRAAAVLWSKAGVFTHIRTLRATASYVL
jgi:hypothetical protein